MPSSNPSTRAALGIALLLGVGSVSPLAGQADSLSGYARAQYREGALAANRGAWKEARPYLDRAAAAWPYQIVYLIGGATAAARLEDTAAVVTWLERIATAGLALDLGSDSALAAIAAAPVARSARTRVEANARPLGRSTPIETDAPADFYPEGLDYDSKANGYLMASVRKRTLVRVAADGKVTPFLPSNAPALDAVMGVRVDAERDLVWATTRGYPAMEGFRTGTAIKAQVVLFDRRTGRQLGSAEAPNDGKPHWFGDLVLAKDGTAYVTDSESPVIFKAVYRGGRVELTPVATDRLFRSLQGVAVDSTGKRLFVADYSHGLMLVTLATGAVRYLAPPAGTTLLGIDGIARVGNALIAVQNGIAPPRVVRIELDGDANPVNVTVVDRHLPLADEPTIGTVVGDRFVYVANSQWEKYAEDGSLKPTARLVSPVLLAVPLRP